MSALCARLGEPGGVVTNITKEALSPAGLAPDQEKQTLMHGSLLATRSMERGRRSGATSLGQSILVADEDSGVREVIRYILEAEGMTVETAANGYQVLARALYRRPMIVMLDVDVLFLSAETVVRELRATYGDSLPVILMSTDEDVAEVASRLGADDYLIKPFSRAAILGAVQRSLTHVGAA